jgi:hypothetical protein
MMQACLFLAKTGASLIFSSRSASLSSLLSLLFWVLVPNMLNHLLSHFEEVRLKHGDP